MAFNNIEIEIKLQVDEKQFNIFKTKLTKDNVKVEKYQQSDLYYIPLNKKGYADTEKHPYKWIRLRKQKQKVFLTYKHHLPEGVEQYSYSKEYETEIDNIEVLELIFNEFGYNYTIQVNKTRELFNYKNEFEISFDVVDKLGFFIEIESLKDFGSADKTKKMIYKFIKEHKLDNCKIICDGYPLLLNKKSS